MAHDDRDRANPARRDFIGAQVPIPPLPQIADDALARVIAWVLQQ
jgi:hypothetical protein